VLSLDILSTGTGLIATTLLGRQILLPRSSQKENRLYLRFWSLINPFVRTDLSNLEEA